MSTTLLGIIEATRSDLSRALVPEIYLFYNLYLHLLTSYANVNYVLTATDGINSVNGQKNYIR